MKTKPLIPCIAAMLLAGCGGSTSLTPTSSSIEPSSEASSSKASIEVLITDSVGRQVNVVPGSYKNAVCIGAGALRLYSYINGAENLGGVEDIDNETLESRPKMFDGVARPYVMANSEAFSKLPSCGVGGPNAQAAEAEKILSCNPDIIFSEYEDADKSNALSKQTGVPVIALASGTGGGVIASKLYQSLSNIGIAMDKAERAKNLIDFHKAEEAAISSRTEGIKDEDKPNVYICGLGNWGTTNQFMTAQNFGPFNVAHIANVVNDLPNNGVQKIEEEKFAALAPKMDVMIFDAAAVKNVKGKGFDFSICKAFQTGEVYLQMAYNAYYTNVEIALLNTWFAAKSVYPSQFQDIDIAAKTKEITEKFNGKDLTAAIAAKPQSFGGYQKIADPTAFFA